MCYEQLFINCPAEIAPTNVTAMAALTSGSGPAEHGVAHTLCKKRAAGNSSDDRLCSVEAVNSGSG